MIIEGTTVSHTNGFLLFKTSSVLSREKVPSRHSANNNSDILRYRTLWQKLVLHLPLWMRPLVADDATSNPNILLEHHFLETFLLMSGLSTNPLGYDVHACWQRLHRTKNKQWVLQQEWRELWCANLPAVELVSRLDWQSTSHELWDEEKLAGTRKFEHTNQVYFETTPTPKLRLTARNAAISLAVAGNSTLTCSFSWHLMGVMLTAYSLCWYDMLKGVEILLI